MTPLIESYGQKKCWVRWRYATVSGKETKIPLAASGQKASTTNPATWSCYEQIEKVSDKIGIVFTPDKKLLGVDIDHVLVDKEIVHDDKEKILAFLKEADTYTEISPSGTGLHIFLAITEPLSLIANKKAPFEAYTSGRYFTVTSLPYGEVKPVSTVSCEEATRLLGIIGYPWSKTGSSQNPKAAMDKPEQDNSYTGMDDNTLLDKMFSAKNGEKIRRLYMGDISDYAGDDSAADMALLAHLAFWTDKEPVQMERIWLASPLGDRQKTQDREDYRRRTVSAAITSCEETYHPASYFEEEDGAPTDDNSDDKSQAGKLLSIINNRKDIVLFHDDKDNTYIAFETSGHREIWPSRSKTIKRWLYHEYWKDEKKALRSESLTAVLGVLEGRAIFEGPLHKLNNRFAWHDGSIWYDLSDNDWQAVKISKDGWEIVKDPPILFKRYSHHLPQVVPAKGGDVKKFLNYVNITDTQYQLLLLVFFVSCFIPDFAHVILIIFGSQGSCKTTLSKLLRILIDPSVIEVAGIPETHRELIQALDHHAFLIFDNISFLSDITSDILCKASTGSGFLKRELYTDDEDVVYQIRKVLGLNGINMVGTRADLLDRSLIIELERLDPKSRKNEQVIMENFRQDMPLILGGIFDTVAKAMGIKPSIQLEDLPRMADFAVWGTAIAMALGYSANDFLDAYKENIANQTEVVINENNVGAALVSFMKDKSEWRGEPSKFYTALTDHARFEDITGNHDRNWPQAPNQLVRRLNLLRPNLEEYGISFFSIPGRIREVVVKKIEPVDPTTESMLE